MAAQGGIAASLGNEEEDHWEWHMYDTVKGSDYLADQNATEILAKEAPNEIIKLEHMGVPFSRNTKEKLSSAASADIQETMVNLRLSVHVTFRIEQAGQLWIHSTTVAKL